jgi:hypothetical protein
MLKVYIVSALNLILLAGCYLNKPNQTRHASEQLCLYSADTLNKGGNYVSSIRNCNLCQSADGQTCFILNNGINLGCISLIQTNSRLILIIDGMPINFYDYITKKILIDAAEWSKISENNLTLNIGNKLLQYSTLENEVDSNVTFKFEMIPSYSHVPFIEGLTISTRFGVSEVFYFDGYNTIRSTIDF